MDAKRPTPRYIIIKMPKLKDKERTLKAARENQLIAYRGVPIRLSADFWKETLKAIRDWQKIFTHGNQKSTAKIAIPRKAVI